MKNHIIGRVVEFHKQHYIVESDNSLYKCYMKGKKNYATIGDWVEVSKESYDKNCIVNILERKNIFYRSEKNKIKKLAANIDHVIIIAATKPEFSTETIANIILESFRSKIDVTIILNKDDLKEDLPRSIEKINAIKPDEINIITLSAKYLNNQDINNKLIHVLSNRTTLLVGQSGMGKSTIINKLVPSANAATNEYSKHLGTGKHTTSYTKIYKLNIENSFIIDSPGIQEFSIGHIKLNEIDKGFPEFKNFIHTCQFYNCTHCHEPFCGIIQAVKDNRIKKQDILYIKKLLKNIKKTKTVIILFFLKD
ncbi:ribosome small subunit-dependent GTPase A [Candidatus Kinetoplastidibacterium crithidiae]|uniref:Small ribosomal subunit biogenesis GTPase RsgA n=1 Tax=Candidatus Kinetoplastidibacterium crithidiae TCC036E TaxID=1208918 RepID=M1L4V2_9PROT|nr:ribosome small subunit-dependent GTPase A [Candidatus Kinetoplastibacterium crithidii]AFZ82636.1 ribosome biogenesis GTPase [Candidatus Kinetoplastibacterium crithidii (ex Angomonas deanei ATCC 30255)]AGF47703.1 ribosome biogenesis GTPase [Candidatus Kinetoplastibacterium crithidii TCC036E]